MTQTVICVFISNNIIYICRLYKSVNEYDVLLGIFSGKIGTQEITQKAVEAEARGDYYQAKKLYEEVNSLYDVNISENLICCHLLFSNIYKVLLS